jgi:hypothetical protein
MAEAVRRFPRWSVLVRAWSFAWRPWPGPREVLVCSTDHEPVKDFNPSGEMIDRQSARQPGASDRVRGCNEMNWPVLDQVLTTIRIEPLYGYQDHQRFGFTATVNHIVAHEADLYVSRKE